MVTMYLFFRDLPASFHFTSLHFTSLLIYVKRNLIGEGFFLRGSIVAALVNLIGMYSAVLPALSYLPCSRRPRSEEGVK